MYIYIKPSAQVRKDTVTDQKKDWLVLSGLGRALHQHIRLRLREECLSFVGGFRVMSSVLSMATPGHNPQEGGALEGNQAVVMWCQWGLICHLTHFLFCFFPLKQIFDTRQALVCRAKYISCLVKCVNTEARTSVCEPPARMCVGVSGVWCVVYILCDLREIIP